MKFLQRIKSKFSNDFKTQDYIKIKERKKEKQKA